MGQPHTVGIWRTKPGREDDFIAAWRALPGFKQHLAGMDGLLEDFKTETLELRAEVGDLCATRG